MYVYMYILFQRYRRKNVGIRSLDITGCSVISKEKCFICVEDLHCSVNLYTIICELEFGV